MSSLLEAIKNKRQAIASKSGAERPIRLASQKNIVRILPRWDGNEEGIFFQDFGQHYVKDNAGSVKAVYICTQSTFGKACSICNELAAISASNTDEEVAKLLGEARPSSRILVNAIYINGAHANAKTDPVLLELPVTVFNDILGIMETYKEDHDLNLIGLDGGYDLVITKSGQGRDTQYSVTPSPKARSIDAKVLEKARNLETYAQQEYEAGLNKALTSLRVVTGVGGTPMLGGSTQEMLPAPSRAGSSTRLSEARPFVEEEEEVIDVPAPTPTAKPAKPAPKAEAPVATVDDELAALEDLLADAA